MCPDGVVRKWAPMSLFSLPYAVLLLNREIKISVQSFHRLWNNATTRVSVDGGTNHLHELENKVGVTGLKMPDVISGDFDSIQPQVKEYYEGLGVKFVETPEQDETDFTKALDLLLRDPESGVPLFPKVNSAIVICEPEGRFDQIFANIATLSKFSGSATPVFLQTQDSLSWVIKEGKHEIHFEKTYTEKNRHCGLIPLHGPTEFKTRGLRWDLVEGTSYSFQPNEIVSTSNEIAETTVSLHANKDFFWTMESFLQ